MGEETEKTSLARGLRDVIAGQTSICLLDAQGQQLYYRGYPIDELARHSTFEEVSHLLVHGELPDANQMKEFERQLRACASGHPMNVFDVLRRQYKKAHPMDILATLLRVDGNSVGVEFSQGEPYFLGRLIAQRLIANTSYFAGVMTRWLGGDARLARHGVSGKCARNFLHLLYGHEPDERDERALDVAFILYAEHEFNASTFAVRVAASAHTDMYSAIIAGVGTLRGSRHGGANEEAMKMMAEIGTPNNVRSWCNRFFATPGARLPGFGHAVYVRSDPRTAILKPLVKELSLRSGNTRWYEIGIALEEYMQDRAAQKGRGIPANVDLWTAPLYCLLGIPLSLYTPLFAAARVAGWCAHYLEVRYVNSEPIIRPRAEYIGSPPRNFVSLIA